jgi:hypothetical protein
MTALNSWCGLFLISASEKAEEEHDQN